MTAEINCTSNIIKRSLPVAFEILFLSLHQIVDMAMIGSLGTVAIAAVGLTSEPLIILSFLFFAFDITITTIISHLKADGNNEKIKTILINFLIFSLLLSVILAVLASFFSREMLIFLGAKSDTIELSNSYLQISIYAYVFKRSYCAINAFFRGLGNTKISLYVNATSNILNIIFNAIFIFGLFGFEKMGAVGAAYGTAISCFVSMIFANCILINHFKGTEDKLKISDIKRFSVLNVFEILITSIPFLSEKIMVRLGVIMTVKFVAELGTVPFAAHKVLGTVTGFVFIASDAFAVSAMTFIGENYNNPENAKKYYKSATRLGIISMSIFTLVVFAFGSFILKIFIIDENTLALATPILMFFAVVMPFQSHALITAGAMRGYKKAQIPSVSTTIGIVIIRPILTFILINYFNLGLFGAWIAISVDEVFRFVFLKIKAEKIFNGE